MADNGNSADDYDDMLSIGDYVQHVLNPNVWGIVIAFEGSLLHLRLCPSLAVVKFHEYELQRADDEEYHGDNKEEPPEADNVIDFTKAVDLRKAKTKGAA